MNPAFFHKYSMGCNCNKDGIPLSLKQKIRRETKEKIAEVKKAWKESAERPGKITSGKNDLGFKKID